jgi:hypothetical protein
MTLLPNSYSTFQLCASPFDTGAQTSDLVAYGTSGKQLDTAMLVLNVYGTSDKDSVFLGEAFQTLTCMLDSDMVPIQVMNQGNLTETYSASISGPNAADFILEPGLQVPVVPGQAATFNVTFYPSTSGTETATITISGGQGGTLVLTATAGAAIIAGSTTDTTVVGAVDTFTLPITNSGTCDWTPGTVTVNAPFAYLSGGQTNIPAGAIGTLQMTFAPTAGGTFSSPVTFANSTGISIPPPVVSVNGIAADASVSQVTAMSGFTLGQSYPNPVGMTQQAAVEIGVPVSAEVQLAIVDVKGELVRSVLDRHFDAGTYSVTLDATGLSSGTYYYQMTGPGGIVLTRQMTVVK